VRLLLDTHTFLWWLDDPAQLAEDARFAIANGRNGVYVSSVSFLEIVIKESIGKLKAPGNLSTCLEACRFTELPLTVAHATALRALPPHHKDPFDRTLLAQARHEELTLVSRDPLMKRYDVPLLAA
jgi:PIN domain nuclease of toxin-antitoxin system